MSHWLDDMSDEARLQMFKDLTTIAFGARVYASDALRDRGRLLAGVEAANAVVTDSTKNAFEVLQAQIFLSALPGAFLPRLKSRKGKTKRAAVTRME